MVASDELYERENIILEGIKKAKELYSVEEFSRIISFGNGLWDLKAAQNLKLEFVGVGDRNKEILLANGCEKHVYDFKNSSIEDF